MKLVNTFLVVLLTILMICWTIFGLGVIFFLPMAFWEPTTALIIEIISFFIFMSSTFFFIRYTDYIDTLKRNSYVDQ